jgi:hypothetical protein
MTSWVDATKKAGFGGHIPCYPPEAMKRAAELIKGRLGQPAFAKGGEGVMTRFKVLVATAGAVLMLDAAAQQPPRTPTTRSAR